MSQFSSLPITIQLRILRSLSWNDRKNARLVCYDWYQLVNYLNNITFSLSDQSHQVFTTSCFTRIGSLNMESLTRPLPIYSSTRMNMPESDTVILKDGVSAENILKMLRYFVSNCKRLEFETLCLENVKPHAIKAKFVYEHITNISFEVQLSPEFLSSSSTSSIQRMHNVRLCNHLNALSTFLGSVSLPSLTTLRIMRKPIAQVRVPANEDLDYESSLRKLNDSFQSLLNRHGKQLKKLRILLPHLDMLNHFPLLGDLDSLAFAIDHRGGEYNETYRQSLHQALYTFKTLQKLELFLLRPTAPPEVFDNIARTMLANNKTTLQELRYGVLGRSSLSWLYMNPDLNIKKLDFESTVYDPSYFATPFLPPSFRLNSVTHFEFTVRAYITDWRQPVAEWIIKVFPYLEELKIKHYSMHPVDVITVARFVQRMSKLGTILFIGGSNFAVTNLVEQFLSDNDNSETANASGVEGLWLDDNKQKYQVKIKRPLNGDVFKIPDV